MTLVMLLCLCIILYNTITKDAQLNASVDEVNIQLSQKYPIESLDALVKESMCIVVGTVIENEEISEHEEKSIFVVEKTYINPIEDEDIDVYEVKGTLEVGKQYVLFLEAHESALYPRTIYTSVIKDSMILLEDNSISKKTKYINEDVDIKKLIKYFEKLKKNDGKQKKKSIVIDEYSDYESLIESADVIIEATVLENQKFNKYVSLSDINVKREYKGSIGDVDNLILPSTVKNDMDYMIFLKVVDGQSYTLVTRKDSIIGKDNQEGWNKILELVEAIN